MMQLSMHTGGVFRRLGCVALFSAIFMYGCDSPADSGRWSPEPQTDQQTRKSTLESVQQNDGSMPVSTMIDARPAALINGQQVNWGEMRPLLNEAAGADILEEIILDRSLEWQMEQAGKTINDADIKRERDLLLRTMSDDPNVARRLLEELRSRRGLGETRFQRLLERNARLRSLVSDRVQVTDEQIQKMYDVVHGPKRQARLMILPDLSMAQEAIRRVQGGRSFADVAVDLSTDASASRGGLLEPISRSDPAYPSAIREELWRMNVGDISAPILLNNQYAVVQLARSLSADSISLESASPDLEQAVRIDQQRLLMDQFVERIMNDVSVVIFDDTLREAWKRRTGGNASSSR